MSVASEIQRIKNNISNAYNKVSQKGGNLPSVRNSQNLETSIESIPTLPSYRRISIKENGEYDVTSATVVDVNVPEKYYNGSYDRNGLRTFQYSEYTITTYDKFVYWNKEQNDDHLLEERDLELKNLVKASNIATYAPVLRYLPLISISSRTSLYNFFNNCYLLQTVPLLLTNNITNFSSMFNNCYALRTIPLFDTSKGKNFSSMFKNCFSLQAIPLINTSLSTNFASMFYGCVSLSTIPLLNTANGTSLSLMFYNCYSLQEVPQLNTVKCTNMASMFYNCYALREIPQFDTIKVVNFSSIFYNCYSIETIPSMNASKATSFLNAFSGCQNLKNFNGFVSAGEAYSTSMSAGNSAYKITLSACPLLTYESLINIINNLYDIATKGCKPQNLQLGATNLAKLTAEEIAIAQNKGWTVS